MLSRTLTMSSSSSSASRPSPLLSLAPDVLLFADAAAAGVLLAGCFCFPEDAAGGERDGDTAFAILTLEETFGTGELESAREELRGDEPFGAGVTCSAGFGLEVLLPLLLAASRECSCRCCFEDDDEDVCEERAEAGLVLRAAEGAGTAISGGSGRDCFEESFSSCVVDEAGFDLGGEPLCARVEELLVLCSPVMHSKLEECTGVYLYE